MNKQNGRLSNVTRDILIDSVIKEMQTKIRKGRFIPTRLATSRKLENALCSWRCGQDPHI